MSKLGEAVLSWCLCDTVHVLERDLVRPSENV